MYKFFPLRKYVSSACFSYISGIVGGGDGEKGKSWGMFKYHHNMREYLIFPFSIAFSTKTVSLCPTMFIDNCFTLCFVEKI